MNSLQPLSLFFIWHNWAGSRGAADLRHNILIERTETLLNPFSRALRRFHEGPRGFSISTNSSIWGLPLRRGALTMIFDLGFKRPWSHSGFSHFFHLSTWLNVTVHGQNGSLCAMRADNSRDNIFSLLKSYLELSLKLHKARTIGCTWTSFSSNERRKRTLL